MKAETLGSWIDQSYSSIVVRISELPDVFIPYFRRFIRLLALPYCFIFLIDWKECPRSKIKVLSDLLYIFFVLKTYPYHYSLCRLWESDRDTWKYYYGSIYEPYQRKQFRMHIQKTSYRIIFDDKYICYQLCKAANFPLPNQIACIGPNQDYKKTIEEILTSKKNNKIIIKPIDGMGGKGIIVATNESGNINIIENGKISNLIDLDINSYVVVQEYLKQHTLLDRFSSSVNTIRLVTLLAKDNSVLLLGAYLRFGISGALIDNISTGGIGVGINTENGTLHKIAYGFQSKKYEIHPDSKLTFEGFIIPYWAEIMELTKNIQRNFYYYKLIGHDIAITENGPVIIELNSEPDIIALEMLCGPILMNKKILNQFGTYKLLVNAPSKKLLVECHYIVDGNKCHNIVDKVL